MAVYHSMMSIDHEEAASGTMTKFLAEFLDQDISTWQISLAACPQQKDTSSCGIFAIATAMHNLFGCPVPAAPYQVKLWRVVLARLVAPGPAANETEAATTSLWPYSRDDDQRLTHLAAFPADLISRQSRLGAGDVIIAEGRALLAALAQEMKAAGGEDGRRDQARHPGTGGGVGRAPGSPSLCQCGSRRRRCGERERGVGPDHCGEAGDLC